MKVLVVGGGGREHALAWKIAQSPMVSSVLGTRPNAGMAAFVEDIGCGAGDVDEIVNHCVSAHIGLVVVGPEAPLVAGLSDRLSDHGIPVVGPSAKAARLEGSKAYAKEVMIASGVPTAGHQTFHDLDAAQTYVASQRHPLVIKASGLASGKGVIISPTPQASEEALRSMMLDGQFGDAGACVVVEEFLEGEEASLIALCSGREAIALASSQDHKRLSDGDEGLNTGGMGAYSPAPVLNDSKIDECMEQAIFPVLHHLADQGIHFSGFLYAGLMMTPNGVRVLEYNVRLGDPETQAILPRIDGDMVPLLLACAKGESLEGHDLVWDERPAVCVVMASEGYPVSPRKGDAIHGLEEADSMDDVTVFHAGTSKSDGGVVTSGGRVLGVTARGDSYTGAVEQAYAAVEKITFNGMQFRKDIAHRALRRGEQSE